MTRQFGFQNFQLSKTVRKLRIFGALLRIFDGLIEATKHLFERVVVAFDVTAGQIGKPRARSFINDGSLTII